MSKYIKLEDIKYRDVLYTFATDEELLVATEEDIESLPTIDIVTCKECKHREDRMFEVDGEGICTETCLMFGKIIFNDSEFCNYGRKESDTE